MNFSQQSNELTLEEEILWEIDEKGYIFDYNLSPEKSKVLLEMRDKGILSSLKSLGIKFINEDYFFTFSDNRFNLKVKTVSSDSWLIKG